MVRKNRRQTEVIGDPFTNEVVQNIFEEEEMNEKGTHSENPGLVLINFSLNANNNILAWKNSITRALIAKEKLRFIQEDEETPAEGSLEFNRWRRNDCLVMSWILNTISKDLTEGFSYVASAKELWKAIKHGFEEYSGPMLYGIKRDTSLFSQGNLSILMYFNKLKKYWDELLMLRPIPSCKCSARRNFACNANKKIADQFEEDKLIQFLIGLDDHYRHIEDQILLIEPLPTIDKAYSMLSKVEKQSEEINGRSFEIENFTGEITKMATTQQDATNFSKGGNKEGRGNGRKFKKENKDHLYCTHWWTGSRVG